MSWFPIKRRRSGHDPIADLPPAVQQLPMKHFPWPALVVALVLLGLIGLLAFRLQEEHWKTRVWPEDQPFVRLAFGAEAERPITKEQLRQLMKPFYPRVIRFPDEVCVQLNARMGWTDGGSIYCFDAADRHITRSFPVRP